MTTLKGKKITLIGGAGFIGHNLALELHKQGAEVSVIDNLMVNNLLAFSSAGSNTVNRDLYFKMINQRLNLLRNAGIELHTVDAREYHGLSHILGVVKPQVIVHLAAVAHANKSNKDPFHTFDHSLRTLENALDFSRANGVEQFIYFSSSMVYGNFMTERVSEDHPLNPIGIYGALKLAGEKIVIAYQQVFDLPYTIIRPSALYGARCVSRRVGQIFIENALMGKKISVEGDGDEKLDFTYIDDLVQGISLSVQNPKSRNETLNITYGNSRSIKDMLSIIRQHFPNIEVENIKRDKLMPFRGTLSVDKAAELIGYKPANPIDVGIPKYVEWYKSFMAMAG